MVALHCATDLVFALIVGFVGLFVWGVNCVCCGFNLVTLRLDLRVMVGS